MTSLVGISSSYETCCARVYDDFDMMGRPLPIPAHDHVFYCHDKDYDFSDVMKYAFQSGSSDNVATYLEDFFQSIEIMHNRVLSLYGQSSHVDILEVMGWRGSNDASSSSSRLRRRFQLRLRRGLLFDSSRR